MKAADALRAVGVGTSAALSAGLKVDDAAVLQNSNKLAVRLLPCDVLARVASVGDHVLDFEIELARRLARHDHGDEALSLCEQAWDVSPPEAVSRTCVVVVEALGCSPPGSNLASTQVMASRSRFGPTTRRWQIWSRRVTTRMR